MLEAKYMAWAFCRYSNSNSAGNRLCILYASLHKILHNHSSNDGIGSSLEIQVFAVDAMQCPIEAVRFFHKHNSCESASKICITR
jgi:hypothetical protein